MSKPQSTDLGALFGMQPQPRFSAQTFIAQERMNEVNPPQLAPAPPSSSKLNFVSAAKSYLALSGPKNSAGFVTALQNAFARATQEELFDLFHGCKKYSMKPGNFDKVYERSLEASKTNMTALGLSEDKINDSRPRKAYQARGIKVKNALKRLFWDVGVPDNALSWGNFVRIAEVEGFILEIRKLNQTYKPAMQAALYTNAYWMVASFNEAEEEMKKRFLIVAKLVQKSANYLTVDTTTGAVTAFGKDFAWGDLIDMSKVELGSKTFEEMKIIFEDRASIAALLNVAIMVDPTKLLQTKSFRMSRNKGDQKATHDAFMQNIANFCKFVMVVWSFLDRDFLNSAPTSVKFEKGSTFTTHYYKAYNGLHGFIRSMKRTAFGVTGNENTRENDLNVEVEGAKTYEDVSNLWFVAPKV